MDTRKEAAFILHKHNGTTIKFQEHSNGFYYYDTVNNNHSNGNLHLYNLLNSVNQNESLFTKRQIEDARLARRLYITVGRPSHAIFIRMIRDNLILNCPISEADANRALQIYGTDIGSLRGKTTRTTPEHVSNDLITDIPKSILDNHRNITLCINIFFVDGLAFLGTISRNIRFVTIEHISSRHIKKHILPCLIRVRDLYRSRGFQLVMCHADDEFTSLRASLLALNVGINIAATNEHVPEIERAICTLKECNRAVVNTLPFKHYPRTMKLALISAAATWLNLFPHADGVSDLLSPRTIMTGTTLNYNTHCRVPFGAYCEIHNEPAPSNTEASRTTPAIALNPTGNLQGSYHFLSLATGHRVTRRRWSELPITDAVLARVTTLALREHPTAVINPPPTLFPFAWGPHQPIVDLPPVQPTRRAHQRTYS